MPFRGLIAAALALLTTSAWAQPVEYVRICDAFGTGFYFIPGTDTCLHIGGRVRVEAHAFDEQLELESALPFSPDFVVEEVEASEDRANDAIDAITHKFTTRARGYVHLDARTQTAIGLLRTYLSLQATVGPARDTEGFDDDTLEPFGVTNYDETIPELEYAFIQLSNQAGTFTAGHADSFFDIWDKYDFGTRIGIDDATGEATLFAYTFEGGDGFSATLSLEDPASLGTFTTEGSFGVRRLLLVGGQVAPDVVGNIRVDQAWGYAQISGAARVFNPGTDTADEPPFRVTETVDEELGWAAAAGGVLRLPFGGWEVAGQATYAHGMNGYATSRSNFAIDVIPFEDPMLLSDPIQVLDAWNVRGGLSIPLALTLTGTVDASYTETEGGRLEFLDTFSGDVIARDRTFSLWAVAGNVQWRPLPDLMIGAEVGYEKRLVDEGIEDSDPSTPTDVFGVIADSERDTFGGMVRLERDF